MKFKVFIDGGEGTTGLKINEYLKNRSDIEIINIQEEERKDINTRIEKMKASDITFLCLPDAAAKEIVSKAPKGVKIIDASTAHRTDKEWTYGLPELDKERREKIRRSNRVSVPGCHATGVILLTKPLLVNGIIKKDYPVTAVSVTGYSGGGKGMIREYEDKDRGSHLIGGGQYGLGQNHKHLPEILHLTGLENKPSFLPIVGDFYSGMVVTIPLIRKEMDKYTGIDQLYDLLKEYYKDEKLISVKKENPEDGFIHNNLLSGKNNVEIYIYGSDENPMVAARYDNLGKGASGAAVQNMNIMLGIDEMKGLNNED